MLRSDSTPSGTPKRPRIFDVVEHQSPEDLAVNLILQIRQHQFSLHDVLSALFTSSDSGILQSVKSFYNHGGAAAIVKIWATTQNDTKFAEAAADIVINQGATELNALSEIKELRHPANDIDLDKIENFKLKFIEQHLQRSAPIVLRVITGLATVNPTKAASSTVATICSMLLLLRSQKSNHFQMMMGLYLYSCGCPSAVVDMLSKASISVSLPSLQNALKGMTETSLKKIRKDVRSKPWFLVYDNINFANRKSDQRIDNSDSFESGTTATVVMIDDYITSDSIRPSYQQLCLDDLIPDETSCIQTRNLAGTALIDVLARSSKTYQMCRRSVPARSPLVVAKTVTHPLPSMCIDQSSIVGNVEVVTTVMEKTSDYALSGSVLSAGS
ncbi:hypothetical protein BGZ98_003491 [Dissophora globulifera]|nr:hypothetical protein BGZ98_003491 [Dissophora globulifera]